MKIVHNKTPRPLSIPLPRGKKLHLGPGKSGQIVSTAADHPALKKLVDAGEIEILDERRAAMEGMGGAGTGRTMIGGGPTSGRGGRRSGDR
jgi:hypothetical protein